MLYYAILCCEMSASAGSENSSRMQLVAVSMFALPRHSSFNSKYAALPLSSPSAVPACFARTCCALTFPIVQRQRTECSLSHWRAYSPCVSPCRNWRGSIADPSASKISPSSKSNRMGILHALRPAKPRNACSKSLHAFASLFLLSTTLCGAASIIVGVSEDTCVRADNLSESYAAGVHPVPRANRYPPCAEQLVLVNPA